MTEILHERPREKLARLGAQALKDKELLALLLRTGFKGKNSSELADEILSERDLTSFLNLPFEEMSRIKGIGASKASVIIAGFEISKRAICTDERILIKNARDALVHLYDIRKKQKEHLVVLYLNARNELIAKECVSIGTNNANIAHPREVFEPAVRFCANSIIIAHNHPSGDPSPSTQDLEVTKKLIDSGKILGIEVLDHIIVGYNKHYSISEKSKNIFTSK